MSERRGWSPRWVTGVLASLTLGFSGTMMMPAAAAPGAISADDHLPAPLAGSELALGLAEAIALALRRNTQLQSAYLDRVVDQLNLAVAEAQFRPRGAIALGAQQRRSQGDNARTQRSSTLSPALEAELPTGGRIGFSWNLAQAHGLDTPAVQTSRSSRLSLDLTQPLLRGGGLAVGQAPLEIARLQETANALGLEETVVGTIDNVISAYRNLLQGEQGLEIAKVSLERTREQLERNRTLVERGRMASNELVQTESRVASQRFSVSQAEEAVDQSRLELLRLLNLGRDTRLRLVDTIELEALDSLRVRPPPLDEGTSIARENRPDYLRLKIARQIESIGQMLAEDGHLWRLDLSASLDAGATGRSAREATGSTLDQRPGSALGLELEIPILDPERPVRLLESRIRLQQSEIQFSERGTELELEVERSLNDLNSRWQQLGLAQRSLELARESLEVERERLAVGRTTSFQVNATEQNLQQAEQSLLDAVIGYLNAQTALDRALGTTLDSWGLALPAAGVMP